MGMPCLSKNEKGCDDVSSVALSSHSQRQPSYISEDIALLPSTVIENSWNRVLQFDYFFLPQSHHQASPLPLPHCIPSYTLADPANRAEIIVLVEAGGVVVRS